MFFKKPSHRIFDYTPRFYKQEEDEKEKKKKKLGFSRQLKVSRKKRSPMLWLLLVVLAILIYLKLSGIL
jgi:ATP/ADP translocase